MPLHARVKSSIFTRPFLKATYVRSEPGGSGDYYDEYGDNVSSDGDYDEKGEPNKGGSIEVLPLQCVQVKSSISARPFLNYVFSESASSGDFFDEHGSNVSSDGDYNEGGCNVSSDGDFDEFTGYISSDGDYDHYSSGSGFSDYD